MRARAAATTAASPLRDWHPGGRRGVRLRRARSARSRHRLRRQGDALRSSHGPGAEVGPRVGACAAARDYRTLRTAPLVFSPVDPHTLFFASNIVWKTTNGGKSWTQISPDLTRTRFDRAAERRQVCRRRPRRAARHARRRVHGRAVVRRHQTHLGRHRRRADSRDGRRRRALERRDAARARDRPWSKVSIIDASHFDANTAYAAINTLRLDDLRPHIYRTHDGGKTWTQIIDGHPRRRDRQRRARGSEAPRAAVRRHARRRCGSRSTTATIGSRCGSTCRRRRFAIS